MNKNQMEGSAKDIAGKVQQKVGQITGSSKQQVKGAAKQVEGKVQRGVGDVEETVQSSARTSTTKR